MLPQQAAEFTPYGATHLGAVGVLLAGALALVLAARQVDDPADRLGKALALVIVLTTLPLQVLYFTPEHWSLQRSIPIQLCDVATLAAAYALWTHRWWAVGLTYYWGLTLTTQAIATPDLRTPFPEPIFLLYWAMHIGTVWAAVHLTWGRRLAPDWRSYRFAMAATTVWVVLILVVNLVLGTNYGYLNEKPRSASVLDLLGPWPWYVVTEALLVAAGWALVTWPWVVALRRRRRQPAATP